MTAPFSKGTAILSCSQMGQEHGNWIYHHKPPLLESIGSCAKKPEEKPKTEAQAKETGKEASTPGKAKAEKSSSTDQKDSRPAEKAAEDKAKIGGAHV